MKAEGELTGYQSNGLTDKEHGRKAQIERGSQKRGTRRYTIQPRVVYNKETIQIPKIVFGY